MENTTNPANGTNGAPQNGMPQNDAPKNSATTTVSGIPAYLCYGGFALGLVLLLLTFFVEKWSTGVLFALALIAIIACIVGREMTKEYKDFSGRKLAKIGIILAIRPARWHRKHHHDRAERKPRCKPRSSAADEFLRGE